MAVERFEEGNEDDTADQEGEEKVVRDLGGAEEGERLVF